jgi:hypothetical protein
MAFVREPVNATLPSELFAFKSAPMLQMSSPSTPVGSSKCCKNRNVAPFMNAAADGTGDVDDDGVFLAAGAVDDDAGIATFAYAVPFATEGIGCALRATTMKLSLTSNSGSDLSIASNEPNRRRTQATSVGSFVPHNPKTELIFRLRGSVACKSDAARCEKKASSPCCLSLVSMHAAVRERQNTVRSEERGTTRQVHSLVQIADGLTNSDHFILSGHYVVGGWVVARLLPRLTQSD